jgi:hypothetical protein
MNYQTIVAAFDTPANGKAAVEALRAGGFHAENISWFDKSRRVGLRQPGLWDRMFGGGLAQHQADVYNQSLKVAHATGIQASSWRRATAAPVQSPVTTRWTAASAIVASSTGS